MQVAMMYQPELETMPRAALEALQLERLRLVLERVYARVPLYRARFDEAGVKPSDLRTLADLARFPFTRKQDLRDHYPLGLLAVDKRSVARIHGSSGTKGKPTLVSYTKGDLDRWSEIVARSIVTAGGRPGDVFHVIYGYGLFTGGLGFHYGAERLGMTVVPVSGGQTARQATLMEDLRPRGIAGTPSYCLTIAEHMKAEGKDPRAVGIEYGIFGAEPWTEEMRQKLEDAYGLKAMDVYGLSEVIGPGVGIECVDAQEGLHIAEDHFLVEVIDPETLEPVPPGTYGELVFTTLTKEAMPVVRYRTGDVAALIPEPCRCGRTHVRMTRIKGRIDDMLIVRGVNVFPSEIEAVLFATEGLAPHYQIVVERESGLDRLTVLVELDVVGASQAGGCADSGAEQALCARVASRLRDVLGLSTDVRAVPAGSLPRSEGKAQRVVDRRHVYA